MKLYKWVHGSFDATLGEMESMIKMNLFATKVILINFVIVYTTINEQEKSVTTNEAEVNIKYKMMDKKVEPMTAPMPKAIGRR